MANAQHSAPLIMDDVRQNPFCLDGLDVKTLKIRPRVIVTNEPFQSIFEEVSVKYIKTLSFPLFNGLLDWGSALITAVCLILEMRRSGAVGLISLGKRSGSIFCFLNSFGWLKGGPVLAYRVLLPAHSGRLKTYFIGRSLRSVNLIAVWSRAQIENYHRAFGCPRSKFVFLPYKANHSRTSSVTLPVGDYIFSGGNSERDYKTLFEAVRGLSIPVIVSTTKPALIRGLVIPENVILVKTEKAAFERLMAGSRMLAMCVKEDIIRGSGEATFLNAMWHGKPVIVADNISAGDYIQDGVEGFVVPAGSAEQMRLRILELWKDPMLAAKIGEAGRCKVANFYTHHQHKVRIQTLVMLMFGCHSTQTMASAQASR